MTASLYQSLSSCGPNDCLSCSKLRIPSAAYNSASANADGPFTQRPATTLRAPHRAAVLLTQSNVLEKYAPEARTDSNQQSFSIRAKRSAHPSTNREPGMTLRNPAPAP